MNGTNLQSQYFIRLNKVPQIGFGVFPVDVRQFRRVYRGEIPFPF